MKRIVLILTGLFLFNVVFVMAGHLEDGKRYFEQGKYNEAEREFTEYIEQKPNDPLGYKNRVSCRLQLKDYNGVVSDCSRILELDPNSCFAYLNRGLGKSALGMHRTAIEDFTKAIELCPNDAVIKSAALNNRAVARQKLGEIFDAIQDYDTACELGLQEACNTIKNVDWEDLFMKSTDLVFKKYNQSLELGQQQKYDDAIKIYNEVIDNLRYIQKLENKIDRVWIAELTRKDGTNEYLTSEKLIGKTYWRLFYIYKAQATNLYINKQYNECKMMCEKGLSCVDNAKKSYKDEADHSSSISKLLNIFGDVYYAGFKNCQKAKECFNKALAEKPTDKKVSDETDALLKKIKNECP